MAKVKETGTVELKPIKVNHAVVTIVGDSDLVLNKMNAVTVRQLTDIRKDKAKSTEKPNIWEQRITAIHWYDGTPTDFSEESMVDALKNNKPCITCFGLKKSFMDAVVRNGIDTYSTKFAASVNVLGKGNLVPVRFADYYLDERLMSPKRGAPVLVYLSRFSGWSADVEISYVDTAYSVEQILNIVNLAGFGLGIGSGRSSGYGRYHVEQVIQN